MYSGVVSVVLWVQFGAVGVVDVVWCSVVYLVQFGVVWRSWCRMWSSKWKVKLKSLKKIWKNSGFTENQTMTWPIAPSIEYNQANWKEIRPIYIPDRWWKWNDLQYMIWNTSYFPSHVTCLKLWSRQSIVIGIWKLKFRYCKKASEKGSQRYPNPLNPSLNKTSFLDGKQQRHFGKVIKQIAENGLAAANVRVPKEFWQTLQFFTKLISSYQSPSFP